MSTTKSCCLAARRTFQSSSDRNVQTCMLGMCLPTISHKCDQSYPIRTSSIIRSYGNLFTLLSIRKYLYTSAKLRMWYGDSFGSSDSFGSIGHGRRAPLVIGNLDGLEEITILPPAWRLRTRHKSQETPKEDMLPVPILFWLVPFIDSPSSKNKGSPKSQIKLRRQIRTTEITGPCSHVDHVAFAQKLQPPTLHGDSLQAKTYCKS